MNQLEKKGRKIQIPALGLRDRLLFYLITLVCIGFSLFHVMTEYFPYEIGIVFYVLAAGTLSVSCYY